MKLSATGRHALRLLAVFTLSALLVLPDAVARAQSSVRPPDTAVTQGVPGGVPDGVPGDVPAGEPGGLTAPLGTQSDADIWRNIKEGGTRPPARISDDVAIQTAPGRTRSVFETFLAEVQAEQGTATSNSGEARLVQVLGEDWRLLRQELIVPYAGWVLVAVIAMIALFFVVRGRIRIEGGRSGRTIPRFSRLHRIAHWSLAATFFTMALSGLVILLGRPVLVPLIGKGANATLSGAMILVHNVCGPVFILSLVVVIALFMKGNFFQRADLGWILKGGGLIGGHASSHKFNFGEKTWYWVVVFVGLTMSATGLLLVMPWVTDVIVWHQLASVVHVIGAIGMISFALGHAYVGSIGMEGSLESMVSGEVDANWAREHHDLWYEEVTGQPAGNGGGRGGDDPPPGRATGGAAAKGNA